MKVVLVTGGFDPIHSGHIAYFRAAKKLGDKLVVGLNSDEWLERKKGRAFMPWNERLAIVNNLEMVDETFTFLDDDNTAKNFILQVRAHYPDAHLIFANGGDRTSDNIPEMDVEDNNITFEFAVGGDDKKNSSSWILSEWDKPKTQRHWGYYRNLDQNGHWKVKELTIAKDKNLSDQRHFKRSEHWHIVDGDLMMNLEFEDGLKTSQIYHSGDSIDIPVNNWHYAVNVGSDPVKVIEVWMGSELSEEDIERRTL